MQECLIVIKPAFLNKQLIDEVILEITGLGFTISNAKYTKYTLDQAKNHYKRLSSKPFFNELIEYLSSDIVFGFVAKGNNAISVCRNKIEDLRVSLKEKYNLNTDVMRNILHCTSLDKSNGNLKDMDSKREIETFLETDNLSFAH